MHIRMDVPSNHVEVDGIALALPGKHEALFLQGLINQGSGGPGFQFTAWAAELVASGYAGTPTRAQIARLVASLRKAFSAKGMVHAFNTRFTHAPRQQTVGPWRWRLQPGDTWTLGSAPGTTSSLRALPALRLPGGSASARHKTRDADRSALPVLSHLLTVERALWEGDHHAAEMALSELRQMAGLSPLLRCWALLREADIALQARDFHLAQVLEKRLQTAISSDTACRLHLGGPVALLQLRIRYAHAPRSSFDQVAHAATVFVEHTETGAIPSIAHLPYALACNMRALALRRKLESEAADMTVVAQQTVIRDIAAHFTAAMLSALFIRNYELLQNVCANRAHFEQIRFEREWPQADAQRVFAWYALSQAWHNRFSLADNSVWEYIFLGDFWLYNARCRAVFSHYANKSLWQGLRPDQLAFYWKGLKQAQQIDDPRQLAHAALNAYHFGHHMQDAPLSKAGLAQWRDVGKDFPDVVALLAAEGYPLPESAAQR